MPLRRSDLHHFHLTHSPIANVAPDLLEGSHFDTTQSANCYFLSLSINASASSRCAIFIPANTGKLAMVLIGWTPTRPSLPSVTSFTGGSPFIATCTWDPTNNLIELWVNGVVDATTTYASTGSFPANASSNASIGSSNGLNKLVGGVNRMGLFKRALTADEKLKAEAVAASKVGLLSLLPGSNPYKAALPYV